MEDLKRRAFNPGQIDVVCCDMWDPYLNGLRNHTPQARVVFDRFHVMGQINQAIERVRREEQRANAALKETRFLWLKNPKKILNHSGTMPINIAPKIEPRIEPIPPTIIIARYSTERKMVKYSGFT